MKTTVVALIVLATSSAIAGHHCVEESEVVGYQRCSRFGVGWTGRTLGWELGATMLRVPIDPIDRDVEVMRNGATSSYRVVTPPSLGAATGLRLRNLYGLTDHFYLATELTLGHLTAMPSLGIEPVVRDTMPVDDTTTGWLFGGMLAAGVRSSAGIVALGGELAFGPRAVVFSNSSLPGVLFGQGGPALEARAHASVWLSMHWTIGAMAATSVFDRHDVSMTLTLGLHAFPFDGGR